MQARRAQTTMRAPCYFRVLTLAHDDFARLNCARRGKKPANTLRTAKSDSLR
jgi:hypothetical protein